MWQQYDPDSISSVSDREPNGSRLPPDRGWVTTEPIQEEFKPSPKTRGFIYVFGLALFCASCFWVMGVPLPYALFTGLVGAVPLFAFTFLGEE